MNYLKEILAFNNWKRYNSTINKSDICLWHALMAMANRFNWEEFNAPILTLLSESSLTKNELYKSRNKLKQLGLIDFKERGGNKTTIYKVYSIVSLYGKQLDTQNMTQIVTQSMTQIVTQSMTQIVTQSMTQIVTQSMTQMGSQIGNIHKTKNHKLETKNQKEKSIANAIPKKRASMKIYGEYKNVLLSDDEYEKLKELCGEELQGVIDHLSSYIEMKGYKVKSHYLAIRKWVITAYKEQKMREERINSMSGGVGYGKYPGYTQKKLCTEYPE